METYFRNNRKLLIIWGIILTLIITNPTPSDYNSYLMATDSLSEQDIRGRSWNFFIFSIYRHAHFTHGLDENGLDEMTVTATTYLGVAKNFIQIDQYRY